MQDSVESLWFRFLNLRDMAGRSIMQDTYYETTTLYALGRVLAFKHIVVSEGIYASIEMTKPGIGVFLRDRLEDIDKRLDRLNYEIGISTPFYRYDRQALAESVTERDGNSLRTSTYLDFRQRYENPDSKLKALLKPAREFIFALDGSNVTDIMGHLSDIAEKLEQETGVKTSVRSREAT